MDITHYEDQHYLTLIDYGPSRFSIWDPLQHQNAASIIRQLESVFSERGPPAELLTDNGAAFSREEFRRFDENWGLQQRFRCAYVLSSNGIVERCHRTIKHIAARMRCSVMEALYWYNVTPKDDATASTAPANAIYNYRVRVKGRDTAPPLGHVDSGPFNVRDTVWVKSPHGRCSTQFKKGMVTGIYSLHSVLINRISRHIKDLRPRHRSVISEDNGSNSSSESDSSTLLLYGIEPGDSSTELEEAETDNADAENERGPLNIVMEESRPILRRSSRRKRPPSPFHLCDCEIREEFKREMYLPPEKRAHVCLACKSENGRSNVF